MNRTWILGTALTISLLGCEDEPVAPPPPTDPQQAVTGAQQPAAGAPGATPGAPASGDPSGLPPLPDREISERDFLESPTNRDPFRAFEDTTQAKETRRVETQRRVVVANYALEELKMSGIVSGGTGRVLVTDPTGLGHVLKIGDFVGKAEVVHSGGPVVRACPSTGGSTASATTTWSSSARTRRARTCRRPPGSSPCARRKSSTRRSVPVCATRLSRTKTEADADGRSAWASGLGVARTTERRCPRGAAVSAFLIHPAWLERHRLSQIGPF
jgi:hypothetical protein